MKEGWEKKMLGEIASVAYGFTGKAIIDGTYRYVRITDIDNNGELTTEEKRYLEYSEEAEKFKLKNNDLLMARTGATFAKVLLYEDLEPSVFASYLIKIDFKENINNKLYWYFSKSENYWEQANSLSTGSAQPHFNGTALKNVVFTFPKSLEEQKQILAILDKAFAAIDQAKANIEKNIANAKELFQSKLNAIFSQKGDGWKEKTWNEVLEIRSGRNQKAVENPDGKYPIIGSAGKVMNYADDYLCEEGTTIIGRKGTINNPMYMETKFWNVDTAFGLHALEGLDKKFLYFFCLSYDFTQRDKGSGRPSLVKNDLLKMKMPLPQIAIQETTVVQCEKLNEQLNELKESYIKKSNSLEDLKKSILQKAFAGELTNKSAVSSKPLAVNT